MRGLQRSGGAGRAARRTNTSSQPPRAARCCPNPQPQRKRYLPGAAAENRQIELQGSCRWSQSNGRTAAQDSASGKPANAQQFQGENQAHDRGEILRSRAPLVFVASTEQQRFQAQRRPREESAGALGAMKFMAADGNQVRIELANVVEGLLSKPLDRIGVVETPRSRHSAPSSETG